MKPATRSDWNLEPLPADFTILKIDRDFSSEQMNRIKQGFIPLDMDDRWFIYYEAHTLYFYRSWSGICIFVVKFKEFDNGSGEIYEVLVTNDKGWQEYSNEEHDRLLLHSLIYEQLLGEY